MDARVASDPTSSTPLRMDSTDGALVEQVVDHYQHALTHAARAHRALRLWKLDHPALIHAHGLGFADRSLGDRLPSGDRMGGALLRGRLMRLGLLRTSGHERFRGAITVPIRDASGRLIEVCGRKIERKLRPDSPREVFLTRNPTGLFNYSALKLSSEVIVCGSVLDALTVWSAGLFNVVGLVGQPPPDLSVLLAGHEVRRVIFALPRDNAGDRLAMKLARQAAEVGIEVRRLRLPRRVTVNAFVRPSSKATDSLRFAAKRARPMDLSVDPPARPSHDRV